MSLNAKNIPMAGGGNYERPDPLEPGSYPARLVQVILLGIQAQRPFQGEDKPPQLEVMLTYEFLDEFLKDEEGNDIEDKPRWLSETIPLHNLAVDRAKSTKRYYALDPNDEYDGDWSQLLGKPCMVNVINREGKGKNAGKIYENISDISTMRPKEAAKAPELVTPAKVFDFYEPDMDVFNALPEWIQSKMKEALDFEGSALETAIEEGGEPKEKPKKKEPAKKQVKAPDTDEGEDTDGEDW
jgi:hypothetical protein